MNGFSHLFTRSLSAVLLLAALGGVEARPLPQATWWGLTFADVSELDAQVDAVASLPAMPFVRIVFDDTWIDGQGQVFTPRPGDYSKAITRLRPHAYLLGQLLDSSALVRYTPEQYRQRVTTWLEAFESEIDLWETCNECNGVSWVGPHTAAKAIDAIRQVKDRGLAAAITLYFAPTSPRPQERDPVFWALDNLPRATRERVDAALISYFPHDCDGPQDWTRLFSRLQDAFPNARIGFGEIGTTEPRDDARAQAILTGLMGLEVPLPAYITGGFWWYAAETMVPKTRPLWSVFEALMSGRGAQAPQSVWSLPLAANCPGASPPPAVPVPEPPAVPIGPVPQPDQSGPAHAEAGVTSIRLQAPDIWPLRRQQAITWTTRQIKPEKAVRVLYARDGTCFRLLKAVPNKKQRTVWKPAKRDLSPAGMLRVCVKPAPKAAPVCDSLPITVQP